MDGLIDLWGPCSDPEITRRMPPRRVDLTGGARSHAAVRPTGADEHLFEQQIRENLAIGRPEPVQLIHRSLHRPSHILAFPRACADRRNRTLSAHPPKHLRIKQYYELGRALRLRDLSSETRPYGRVSRDDSACSRLPHLSDDRSPTARKLLHRCQEHRLAAPAAYAALQDIGAQCRCAGASDTGTSGAVRTAFAALIALRAFEREHGVLPSSLEALVPTYIDTVPRDHFDGAPLRYAPDCRVLWSVGEDLRDAVGESGNPDARGSDDVIFPICRPQPGHPKPTGASPTGASRIVPPARRAWLYSPWRVNTTERAVRLASLRLGVSSAGAAPLLSSPRQPAP